MVARLPAKAVPRALQLERQMLESDLAQKRTLPLADVRSIVAFCNFLETPPGTSPMTRVSVPIQHLGFYRNTVKRLIEDGALPFEAATNLENTFSAMLKAA
jgi:hypothetical protein